ncbi:MAG: O-antigen ligase family protein [Chlamydiota bacterium]
MTLGLLVVLILIIPFDVEYQAFRKFSRALSEKFERTTLAPFRLPPAFYRIIHYHLSDVIACLVVIFAFRSKFFRATTLFFDSPMRWLTLLFLACFCSIVFSAFSYYHYLYFTLMNLGFPILTFSLTYQLLKDRPQLIYWIAAAIIAVAFFESLIAIGQFITQEKFGIYSRHNLGFATLKATPEMRRILSFLGASIPLECATVFRANGTFPHPNHCANFLILSLMLSHYFIASSQSRWQKIALLFATALQVLALGTTFSRAGIIGYFIGLFFWNGRYLFAYQRTLYPKKEAMKFLVTRLFLSIMVPICVLAPFFHVRGGVRDYMRIVESDEWRVQSQDIAIEMFQKYPVMGIGYRCFTFCHGDFPSSYGHYPRDGNIHNIYFLFLAETGLVGLALFCAFLIALLSDGWRRLSLFSLSFFATFMAFLFMALCDLQFIFYQNGRLLFFITAGLLSAAGNCQKKVFQIKPLRGYSG